jgi:hypothetical protein
MNRSECCLPAALSAGLLPKDIARPPSGGLIAQCTGRVVEVAVGDLRPKEMLTAEVTATPAHIRPTRLALTTTDISWIMPQPMVAQY